MATTNDIYAEMQRYAPLELAESWDNPGLLVDCAREVSRVLVTLDITPEVVEEAAAGGCELIVSPPGHLQSAEKADPPGCILPAGAKGHLCHLYAHQSGCS